MTLNTYCMPLNISYALEIATIDGSKKRIPTTNKEFDMEAYVKYV